MDSKLYVMNIDGIEPAPGVGRLGSLAAERHVEGRRHAASTSPRRIRDRRTSTSCRWPAAGRRRADGDQGHAHADDVEHREGQSRRRARRRSEAARHRHASTSTRRSRSSSSPRSTTTSSPARSSARSKRSGTRPSTGTRSRAGTSRRPTSIAAKKYPLQLHIHGGPHSMYGVGFNFGWQEHAANGYVILYTNPRGSTGYGSAFGNMISNAYPSKDFDDLMAGVDEVMKKGFVDESNLFVTGCSGGGVLTAWIVGHTDRFAAASANCPVIDWAQLRRHDRRRELVLQLREAAVGGPERAHPPLAADVRRQRQDADDADDRRAGSAHADAADRAVLQRAQAAQGADGDGPLQRRVARHDVAAVEFHAHAALYCATGSSKYGRPASAPTTAGQ